MDYEVTIIFKGASFHNVEAASEDEALKKGGDAFEQSECSRIAEEWGAEMDADSDDWSGNDITMFPENNDGKYEVMVTFHGGYTADIEADSAEEAREKALTAFLEGALAPYVSEYGVEQTTYTDAAGREVCEEGITFDEL